MKNEDFTKAMQIQKNIESEKRKENSLQKQVAHIESRMKDTNTIDMRLYYSGTDYTAQYDAGSLLDCVLAQQRKTQRKIEKLEQEFKAL